MTDFDKAREMYTVNISVTKGTNIIHVQLTHDNETVFTADAYSSELLNDTLRMLCDWISDESHVKL